MTKADHRRDALQVLLTAYQVERQGDQNAIAASMALIGAGAGFVVAAGFVLLNHNRHTPGWLVALLPLPPLPLTAIAILQNNSVSLRGFYLRLLEQQLDDLVDVDVCPLRVPVGYRLGAQVWQGLAGRIGQAVIYVPLLGLYIVLVVDSALVAIDLNAPAAVGLSLAAVMVGLVVLFAIYWRQWDNQTVWNHYLQQNPKPRPEHRNRNPSDSQ